MRNTLAIALIPLTLAACVPPGAPGSMPTRPVIAGQGVGVTQQLTRVRILATREVERLDPTGSNTMATYGGGAAGAVAGGALGSQIGKGSGKKLATVLGAVAGAYGGAKAGQHLAPGRALATEYIIQPLEGYSRQTAAVVLDGPAQFAAGDEAYYAPTLYGSPARLIPAPAIGGQGGAR